MQEIPGTNNSCCCPKFVVLTEEKDKLSHRCRGATRRVWRIFCIQRAAEIQLQRIEHIRKCGICFDVIVNRNNTKGFRLAA